MKNEILIILPTINEKKNIKNLYRKIKALNLNLKYLFIDDNSTDGTLELIKKLLKKNKKIFLMSRKKRFGIGKAHKDGLIWAYKKKIKYVVTMDTDFAHEPKYIPALLKKVKTYDLVVGSRYLKKNSTPNWPKFRIFLSQGAHIICKILFNLNLDSTNAFRCYNLKKINKNFLSKCKSDDYDFFFTSLVILNLKKYKISQIPMIIKNRTEGVSKMLLKHVFKSIFNMFFLFLKIRLGKF